MVGTELPGTTGESNGRQLSYPADYRAFIEDIECFSIGGYGLGIVGRECVPVYWHAASAFVVPKRRREKLRPNHGRTVFNPSANLEWIRRFGCVRGRVRRNRTHL